MGHSIRRWWPALLAALCTAIWAPRPAAADSDTAVLILAHGSGSSWQKTIRRAAKGADLPCPYRVFFGMGDTLAERNELQEDVRDLEDKGAHTIIVIPMLVSSYSEAARQWRYLLGMDVQAGFINNPLFPVEKHAVIRYGEPLNDSAVVVEILLDRTQEISSDPAKESVVIVSNGPNDDADNARWLQILASLSARLRERGGFYSVEGASLRDEAPVAVRRQSVEMLRRRIEAIGNAGRRPLVVSLLLAPGGIEHKLGLELRGLNYAFNTKTLLPDARISDWIRSQVP